MDDSQFTIVLASSMTSPKIVTTYLYENLAVQNGTFARGFPHHDSSTDSIQWQRGGIVTPWHGLWKFEESRITVSFDCLAGSRDDGSIRLKSTMLFQTGLSKCSDSHEFEGIDYKGRQIKLTPLTRWSLSPPSDTWTRISEWNRASHDWMQCE